MKIAWAVFGWNKLQQNQPILICNVLCSFNKVINSSKHTFEYVEDSVWASRKTILIKWIHPLAIHHKSNSIKSCDWKVSLRFRVINKHENRDFIVTGWEQKRQIHGRGPKINSNQFPGFMWCYCLCSIRVLFAINCNVKCETKQNAAKTEKVAEHNKLPPPVKGALRVVRVWADAWCLFIY